MSNARVKLGRGRCSVCGQFISFDPDRVNEIDWFYVPDTPFTVEQIFFAHKKCIKKNRHDIKYQIFHRGNCLTRELK